jgi:L-lactate permease
VKALTVSLIIWTFIIPCVIAIYLILTFLGAFMPNLYFALIGLVVALATLAIMRRLLWIPQSSKEDSTSLSANHEHPSHATRASLAR